MRELKMRLAPEEVEDDVVMVELYGGGVLKDVEAGQPTPLTYSPAEKFVCDEWAPEEK